MLSIPDGITGVGTLDGVQDMDLVGTIGAGTPDGVQDMDLVGTTGVGTADLAGAILTGMVVDFGVLLITTMVMEDFMEETE